MSKRNRKPSSAPWVLAAAGGLVMAASIGGGVGDSGTAAAAPAQTKPAKTGTVTARAAYEAGFRGEGLVMAIAVTGAESTFNPKASLRNGPTKGCPRGSTDRGLLQINDCYHSEVSVTCAYDPACNMKAAHRISGGGKHWSQWYGYKSGNYRKFMAQARAEAKSVS
jgi:Lysozyme like domain